MKFAEFESIISQARMSRYVASCGGDTRKAMTLYRRNLKLSQELFTVISCFEVALRNAIDDHYRGALGNDWLYDSVQPGGRFDATSTRMSKDTIEKAHRKLGRGYTHPKLVAELGFGFWRYMFARHQFRACGQTLLQIVPGKPASTPTNQYNADYIFNELKSINHLRNRIAHHEPVCFQLGARTIDTTYARDHYGSILTLFQWMNVDEAALLYGLDKVNKVLTEIDSMR